MICGEAFVHQCIMLCIFVVEIKEKCNLKCFDNEKKNPVFGIECVSGSECLCPGRGTCWYQRGDKPHDLVFRPGDKTVLRHRRRARSGGRHQDLRQVQQR